MKEPTRPSSVVDFGLHKRSTPRQLLDKMGIKPSRSRKRRVWKKLIERSPDMDRWSGSRHRDPKWKIEEIATEAIWYNWEHFERLEAIKNLISVTEGPFT